MSSGRFRYLGLISERVPPDSSKGYRTWEPFRVEVQECTSMQVHRMHTRHGLRFVESQIHRLRMFGLYPSISS